MSTERRRIYVWVGKIWGRVGISHDLDGKTVDIKWLCKAMLAPLLFVLSGSLELCIRQTLLATINKLHLLVTFFNCNVINILRF